MANTFKVLFTKAVRGREKGRIKLRVIAPNGEEILSGEKYVRRIDAKRTWTNLVRAIRGDNVKLIDD